MTGTDMQVHEKTRGPRRCALCHGDLAGEAWHCEGCGTSLHADCSRELGKCPTLGCTRPTPALARLRATIPIRAPRRVTRAPSLVNPILGLALVVFAGLVCYGAWTALPPGAAKPDFVTTHTRAMPGHSPAYFDEAGREYHMPYFMGDHADDAEITYLRSDPGCAFYGRPAVDTAPPAPDNTASVRFWFGAVFPFVIALMGVVLLRAEWQARHDRD